MKLKTRGSRGSAFISAIHDHEVREKIERVEGKIQISYVNKKKII